jgi:hypothetical protein
MTSGATASGARRRVVRRTRTRGVTLTGGPGWSVEEAGSGEASNARWSADRWAVLVRGRGTLSGAATRACERVTEADMQDPCVRGGVRASGDRSERAAGEKRRWAERAEAGSGWPSGLLG